MRRSPHRRAIAVRGVPRGRSRPPKKHVSRAHQRTTLLVSVGELTPLVSLGGCGAGAHVTGCTSPCTMSNIARINNLSDAVSTTPVPFPTFPSSNLGEPRTVDGCNLVPLHSLSRVAVISRLIYLEKESWWKPRERGGTLAPQPPRQNPTRPRCDWRHAAAVVAVVTISLILPFFLLPPARLFSPTHPTDSPLQHEVSASKSGTAGRV
jgi:hypothetical protein